MEDKKKLNYCKDEYIELIENCGFTRRELEIFKLRREGLNVEEISVYNEVDINGKPICKYLPTSLRTVERDLKNIHAKIVTHICNNM